MHTQGGVSCGQGIFLLGGYDFNGGGMPNLQSFIPYGEVVGLPCLSRRNHIMGMPGCDATYDPRRVATDGQRWLSQDDGEKTREGLMTDTVV